MAGTIVDKDAVIFELRADLAAMQAEREKIANSIHVHADDGNAPDNLADHVQLLVLEEYYPTMDKIERLENERAETLRLLLDLQWEGGTIANQSCPACDTEFPNHAKNCPLDAMIKKLS
jgi:hypothetical protein